MSDDGIDFQPVAQNDGIDFQPSAQPSFLEKTASNVIPDIKNVGAQLKDLATGPALDIASGDVASAIPKLVKQGEEFFKNPKENAAAIARPVTHPIDYFQEHPVQQTMNVLGAAGGLKGLMEGAPEAVKPPETPQDLPVMQPGAKTGDPHALFAYNDKFGPEGAERSVYNIFGDPNHPALKEHGWGSSIPQEKLGDIPVTGRQPGSEQFTPIGAKAPPQESPAAATGAPPTADAMAHDALGKAQEVKDYISRGYQGFTKKPGAIADVADYVQEKSQMMSAQQMGFTPLQNRQLGATPAAQLEAQRAIGQYGLDSGIVSPTGGLRHMVKTNEQLLNQAGETLGDIRQAADKVRDPAQMTMDPLQEIHAKWDKVFSGAERSDEAAQYERALKIVEERPATFKGMADAATALNKAANKANKLNQPHGAFTDVANTIGQIENPRIRQLLPEKAAMYDKALKEYGINKKIEAALRRKVGGEVKRFGPGSIGSNLVQKGMDEMGYRVLAKAGNKLSTAIKGNPAIAGNLPSLFKEFANHVDDTVGEVSGMSQGGRVPDDVRQYIAKAC